MGRIIVEDLRKKDLVWKGTSSELAKGDIIKIEVYDWRGKQVLLKFWLETGYYIFIELDKEEFEKLVNDFEKIVKNFLKRKL